MAKPVAIQVAPPGERTDDLLFHPRVGEVFEPHRVHQDNVARRACGTAPIYLPAILGALRKINNQAIGDGPKRVYDYLVGRAGDNGSCWPSYKRIAADLGKSERQIQYDVQFLETNGLIIHEVRAGRRSNTYKFVWNETFEREWIATQMRGKIRPISSFEWQDPADLSGSPLPTNLSNESSQQSAAAVRRKAPSSEGAAIRADSVARGSHGGARRSGNKQVPMSCPVAAGPSESDALAEVLSRNNVKVGRHDVSVLLAQAREQQIAGDELVRFVECKCREKATEGDPVRCAKFFLLCIPKEVKESRRSVVHRAATPAPTSQYWTDPYENAVSKGKLSD